MITLPWHSTSSTEVVFALQTDAATGLTPGEARQRLTRYGANRVRVRKQEPWWHEVFESLTEPLQLVLIGVAVAYFLLGERQDAVTILVVILAVAGIEVTNELRAKRDRGAVGAQCADSAVDSRW